jgi:hypothetical protein
MALHRVDIFDSKCELPPPAHGGSGRIDTRAGYPLGFGHMGGDPASEFFLLFALMPYDLLQDCLYHLGDYAVANEANVIGVVPRPLPLG